MMQTFCVCGLKLARFEFTDHRNPQDGIVEHPEKKKVQQEELSTPLPLPAAIDYPSGFGKDTFADIGWVHQSSLSHTNSVNFTKITWIWTKMSSFDYNLTY